jgi:hypothetical protein
MDKKKYTHVFEAFQQECIADDEAPERAAEKLIDLYEGANVEGQKLIDEVFVAMCGWKFTTLRDMCHE